MHATDGLVWSGLSPSNQFHALSRRDFRFLTPLSLTRQHVFLSTADATNSGTYAEQL